MINGNFGGIGIEFIAIRDTVWVLDVVDRGPAQTAGLRKGDKIIAVNDTVIAGKKLEDNEVFTRLRGQAGTRVQVTVLGRDGSLRKATIVRGKIPSPSIEARYMIDAQTGYVRLARFSGTSYDEFITAVNVLKNSGMKRLILDLRGNGGGLLDEATSIADEFIDQGKLLVYTKGRVYGKEEFKSRVAGVFEEGPLEVLVDENSASASEVIAGALQDYDRALLIGRRTFGKGLVQQQYKLNNGGYLRLTIAKYYTPSGRSIQKPYTADHTQYYHEVYERGADTSDTHVDTTRYYTAAGRPVYGSGGIQPDIVVNDTASVGMRFDFAVAGIPALQELAYDYAAAHADELRAVYATPDSFIADYTVPTGLVDQLASSLRGRESKFRTAAYRNAASLRLKAFIGRYLFDRNVLYKLLAEEDVVYQRALQEIRDPRFAYVRTTP
jgi:carboxyl-terminal processing protease